MMIKDAVKSGGRTLQLDSDVFAQGRQPHLLGGRLRSHSPDLLDRRSLAGDLTWGRMAGCASGDDRSTATKATPITLALRNDVDWLVTAITSNPSKVISPAASTGRKPAQATCSECLSAR